MLTRLNRNAASRCSYISFDTLETGRHKIEKFALRESNYGKKEQLLCVYIKNGYVILPERMSKGLNNPKAIEQLNANNYDFVFMGKDINPPYRVNFRFEIHRTTSNDEDSGDDSPDNIDNARSG